MKLLKRIVFASTTVLFLCLSAAVDVFAVYWILKSMKEWLPQ